jgi:DNA-binding IclR family transcriptional regulator
MSKNKPTSPEPASPRDHTKAARLLKMLRTGTGASLDEMVEATGWQPHTVRAAMTGIRKRGFAITRRVEGNTTVWSVGPAAAEPAA